MSRASEKPLESGRVFRTKEAIRQAYLALFEHRRPDEIKAIDIIERARVGKSTFYRYYRDNYDVLNDCFATYLNVEVPVSCESSSGEGQMDWDEVFRAAVEGACQIKQYPKLYLACNECVYLPFVNDFRQSIILAARREAVRQAAHLGVTRDNCLVGLERLGMLVESINTTTLLDWVQRGCPESPEEIASQNMLVTRHFIHSMKTKGASE